MNRAIAITTALLLGCPLIAGAQTGYSITGGMSNFDVGNRCDEPCDEFEVEIEDLDPHEVVHTYRNGNYGSPTVTLAENGTSTIIDYRNPQHLTAVGSIEHFGITLRQLSPTNVIRVRWMRNGRSATVNGLVPVQGGASTPATQPILPSISAEMGISYDGGDGVSLTVTNNDPQQSIWIKRRAQVTQGTVTLEALMPNDPVVTTSVVIDASPVMLAPGASVTLMSDLVEIEDNQSAVFAAQYYQDLFNNAGPFGGSSHAVGPELGNVMTASITSPDAGCGVSMPVVVQQPADVTADEGSNVDIRMDADGNDLPLTFQWMKDGVPISNNSKYSGTTGDELSIEALSPSEEGFYSCQITNACGSIVTNSVLVFITGHNLVPPRPTTGACCDAATGACTLTEQGACDAGNSWDSSVTCQSNPCQVQPTTGACCAGEVCSVVAEADCAGFFMGIGEVCNAGGPSFCCPADFNASNAITVQDIFDFLGAYFAGDVTADINFSGGVSVQDIFDFLALYFGGC